MENHRWISLCFTALGLLVGCGNDSPPVNDRCPLGTWANAPSPRTPVMSGLSGELLLTELTSEQQRQFCEAAHTALNAVPTEAICGLATLLAPDEATCFEVYDRCTASRPSFMCGMSFPAPDDERVAEFCSGHTVAEAEQAISKWFGWGFSGFDGAYCAIPDDERSSCSEHPDDISETENRIINCYYNTTLLPVRQPTPAS